MNMIKTKPPDSSIRLEELKLIIDSLTKEIERRKELYNNYSRACTVCNYINAGMTTVGVVSSSIGVAALSTAALLPAGVPMMCIGIVCGACSGGIVPVVKRMGTKKEKHLLKYNKLNDVKSVLMGKIAEAVSDDYISSEEYEEIVAYYKATS